MALEAEALLRHLDCATTNAAAEGDHGVTPHVVHLLLLNRGQLGILQGRVRITIGIQSVIELLLIVLLNIAHEVLNYSFDEFSGAYRHPCFHIGSAIGSLRN